MQNTLTHYSPDARRTQMQTAVDSTKPHLELVAPVVIGTPQQEAFWAAMTSTKGHIVLEALAGCGKSFSIIEAGKRAMAKWPNISVAYLAFNSSSADDLRPKAPKGAVVKTLHSLGNAAVIKHVGRMPNLDTNKPRLLLADMLAPEEFKRGRPAKELARPVCDLVSLCKSYLYEGTHAQLDELVARHDVEVEPNKASNNARPANQRGGRMDGHAVEADRKIKARIYELVPRVLEACAANLFKIDYDDQIWLPVFLDLPVEQFDLVLGDEVQDWNLCQQRLIFKACPRGRIGIVGDANQSIYGFRGADSKSIPRMTELLRQHKRGVECMPLTLSFRCPKAAGRKAREIVPTFEVMPDAIEGTVENIGEAELTAQAKPGEMVLCRTNAPLVKVAHQLLRAEKKAMFKGKDLSGPIRDLIEGLGAKNIEELGQLLETYRMAESNRLDAAGKSAQVITAHEDKCETLEVLTEGIKTLAELDAKITRIFTHKDPDGAVILTSVHGAKGLEADTVYILRPDLMPHPAALKKGRADDIRQENNIHYVALTRTKNRLIFVHETKPVDDEGDEGDDRNEPIEPVTVRGDHEAAEQGFDVEAALMPQHDPLPIDETVSLNWQADVQRLLSAAYDRAPFDAYDLQCAIETALAKVPR